MSQNSTPDDIADGKTSAKKGYSIWSLLVIMTLLAVWLAVPRRSECFNIYNGNSYYSLLFFGLHQILLWTILATLVWLLTKRRILLVVECIVLFVIWGPLLTAMFEDHVLGDEDHRRVGGLLSNLGVRREYNEFLRYIYKHFGYGPTEY